MNVQIPPGRKEGSKIPNRGRSHEDDHHCEDDYDDKDDKDDDDDEDDEDDEDEDNGGENYNDNKDD